MNKKMIKIFQKILKLINQQTFKIIYRTAKFDISLKNSTETNMPVKSASKATARTKRIFFIFTVLVYIAIVYKVVSVHPIIVDAISPC